MSAEEDVIDDVTRGAKKQEQYDADYGQDQPDFRATAAAAGLGFSAGPN
ncbi:MAG: hypothetical protein JO308_12970 [Verrucomicrobia bacterium]|nr:hypothetical protein [Verrucomicrobiota bacterium]